MNDNFLVSVITPTFNSSKFIISTYDSLYNQTYTNWEWLVVDDCSDDDTYKILCDIAIKDNRVKALKNPENSGAAITRNVAMDNSSGDFLAFLDADDMWLPEKLATQIQYMVSSNIYFSFTGYEIIDESGHSLGIEVDTFHKSKLSYNDMLRKKATLGCSTVMLDFRKFKEFRMPNIRTGQDYAFWLKILKNDNYTYPVSNVLTKYRIVSNSISRNKYKKAMRQWQIYREIENLTLFKSIKCFCFYAWRAVFRK